jgi:site-specific DNA recombinase
MNAIYVRVSTEEQAKSGYSLSDQISSCKLHLLKLGYHDEVIEYIDDGYSGEFSDRPAFSNLRDDIAAGRIKNVVVYDPDRLARKLAVQLLFAEDVEKAGVQLHFITGNYDSSPEGRLFFSMRGAIAEFEKEKIKDRTTRGKRRKASQGKISQDFGLYGYDFEPISCTYTINEDQANVIREIFRLVIEEKMSVSNLQEELHRRIIYSPKGNPFWGFSSIFNILKNETYTGTFQSMRVRYKQNGIHSKTISVRPDNEWIPISVPVIVDEFTFKQAQQQLAKNKVIKRQSMNHNFIFKGILFCGLCGRRFLVHHNHFRNGTTKPYYQCATQRYSRDLRTEGVTCSARTLPADHFDKIVWDKLIEVIYDHDKIAEHLPKIEESVADKADELVRIGEVESALIKRRQTIIKWSGQQMISEGEADEELKQIREQLSNITARKEVLQSAIPPAPVNQKSFKEIADQLRPLIESGNLTPDNKRLIVRSVLSKVTAIRTDQGIISKCNPPVFEFTWELA